jgi:hypothetical protein
MLRPTYGLKAVIMARAALAIARGLGHISARGEVAAS